MVTTRYPQSTPVNLLKHFLVNPREVNSYVKYSLSPKPKQHYLPWLSWPAIKVIQGFVQDGMDVFEFGAGQSTLFFSQFRIHLSSIESDKKWFVNLHKQLNTSNNSLLSTDLRFVPIKEKTRKGFLDSRYADAIKEGAKLYDLILIDGEEIEGFAARTVCFRKAESSIKPGGIIVVDDFWRYSVLMSNHNAREVKVLEGIGPNRKGLTSTAIFYY